MYLFSFKLQTVLSWGCALNLNIQTLRKQRQEGVSILAALHSKTHLKKKAEKWAKIASRTMIYCLISCILSYVRYNTCILWGANGINSILHKQLTLRKLCLFMLDLKINSEQLGKTYYKSYIHTPPPSASQGSSCRFPNFDLTHKFLGIPICCPKKGN